MNHIDTKQNNSYITVVGAVNIDISGRPYKKLRSLDSNPGKMTISFGGVGRNISENISRLGGKVKLITILGDDFYASEIEKNCNSIGIDLTNSLRAVGGRTSTYLCINDEGGDMAVALSDMDIYEKLTPDFLKSKISIINSGKLLVIDANISRESIEYLANNCTIPILAEPVSTTKAMKFENILDKIFLLKPNLLELELLSSMKITNKDDLYSATDILLDKGVENLVVSMGGEGVLHATKNAKTYYPCYPCKVVNTTGCGDSLIGAIAWSLLDNKEVSTAIECGLAAAAICIESNETISKELSKENLLKRMNQ